MINSLAIGVLIDRVKARKADFTPALKFIGPEDQFNLATNKAQLAAQIPACVVSLAKGNPGASAAVLGIDIADHHLVAHLVGRTTSGTKPTLTTVAQGDLLASLFKESALRSAFAALGYDLLECVVGDVEQSHELDERNLTLMTVPVTLTTARKS